jgi:hypothetical protein
LTKEDNMQNESREDAYAGLPDPRTEAELDRLNAEERYLDIEDGYVCPCGNPEEHSGCSYDQYMDSLNHDCPKERFLEDPITVAYGVGGEFVSTIKCAICDDEEIDA